MNALRTTTAQRGAAIVTALIIVTLVATMASAMIWQQWRAVQVEAAERARAQSAWVLNGALDWARLILREDGRAGGGAEPDHLGEPWAVPLAEARLSTFLAADRDRTDDSIEAFLSGSIEDAQARYNVRNLIDGENKIVPAELATLRQLFETVQANPELADRLAAALRAAITGSDGGGEGAPLLPQDTSQLRWLGVPAEVLERLRPYIVLLPATTPVNLNTAPREVIAAVIPGVDLGLAERLVQARARSPYSGLDDVRAQLPQPQATKLEDHRVGITTSFFEVRGRLRLEHRVLEERSLVRRSGVEITPLYRERLTSRD